MIHFRHRDRDPQVTQSEWMNAKYSHDRKKIVVKLGKLFFKIKTVLFTFKKNHKQKFI